MVLRTSSSGIVLIDACEGDEVHINISVVALVFTRDGGPVCRSHCGTELQLLVPRLLRRRRRRREVRVPTTGADVVSYRGERVVVHRGRYLAGDQ